MHRLFLSLSFLINWQLYTSRFMPSKLLDIPLRLQWPNHHGYCGQTAIQTTSIYYGNYISQYQARQMAGSEVLLGKNAEKCLEDFGMNFQVWDNSIAQPQYKRYLEWIKMQLQAQNPVIVVGFAQGMNDQNYDHIYLATGYQAQAKQFNDDDVLTYMDFFEEEFIKARFSEIWDTRAMKGNGSKFNFVFPRDINYGIAVTGVQDQQGHCLPIRLRMQNRDEPNVTEGQHPRNQNLQIEISGLKEGNEYEVQGWHQIQQVWQKEGAFKERFVSKGQEHVLKDSVKSNKSKFYRCIEI